MARSLVRHPVGDDKIDDMTSLPPGAGRPRAANDANRPPSGAREQILDAAAELFIELGFAGASTRAIAERVGIRQQSLYYHFAGKDDILVELLSNSVRPSNEFVASIESRVPRDTSAAAALYALALVDARTLRSTPYNIGVLYLHPEVQDERFERFRNERNQLRAAYGRLGVAASPDRAMNPDESMLGAVLIQVAEVIIQLRRDGEVRESDDATIAQSCLRLIGLTDSEITRAIAEAQRVAIQARSAEFELWRA
ncbi:MAG TPA: helix-turn-helix domain-containing protein [Candidatus Lumbricidophila sp.]|nr:helix-turn-helix domain-containing protein [Candidatus Lumbricidophila sp.]